MASTPRCTIYWWCQEGKLLRTRSGSMVPDRSGIVSLSELGGRLAAADNERVQDQFNGGHHSENGPLHGAAHGLRTA
jgi:hypothetical protein